MVQQVDIDYAIAENNLAKLQEIIQLLSKELQMMELQPQNVVNDGIIAEKEQLLEYAMYGLLSIFLLTLTVNIYI